MSTDPLKEFMQGAEYTVSLDIMRVREYKTYLNSEIERYAQLSQQESLMGSITADKEKGALEKALIKLYEIFPELRDSN